MVQRELKPSPQKENLNLKENEMTKISAREPEKKNINVLGKKMTYVDKGEGDPIIFQHGFSFRSTEEESGEEIKRFFKRVEAHKKIHSGALDFCFIYKVAN